MKKIKKILKQELEIIKPDKNITKTIEKISKDFIKNLQEKFKEKNIDAEIFIGGSVAKKTLIKKEKYDVDIFVRFNEKYRGKNISKILQGFLDKNAKKIHGSRDYFQIKINNIILELVPVLKIKKPEDAENVTDLSYFHVKYVLSKIKNNKKLSDEIILAKSFCLAQGVYGAESYIHGFSGYSLELLIIHYKSFIKFLKEILKWEKNQKIVIDDAKYFCNIQDALIQINEAKLKSPIILIDPTFCERNALAGLNIKTFIKFQNITKKFLENPNIYFFKKKNLYKELNEKYKEKLKILKVTTTKQKGDIAGTKLKKFFELLVKKLNKEFVLKFSEFEYFEKENFAYFYFVVDKKKNEMIKGPKIQDTKNFIRFKKIHKKAFIKKDYVFFERKYPENFEQFFKKFIENETKTIKEMSIKTINKIN